MIKSKIFLATPAELNSQDWEEWDEEVAEALAKDTRFSPAPIELTEEHWKIIQTMKSC